MIMQVDVAVVGGGLGGLALVAGLILRGYDAHVFEAAPELRTSSGTMLALGCNAFTALDGLHPLVGPKIKERGVRVTDVVLHDRPSPEQPMTTMRNPADISGDTLCAVRWSEVQRSLSEVVPATHVHCCHRCTGYTEHAEEGRVLLHFKGQPDVEARLVVAADGLRSPLRAQMVPNDPGIRFLGTMAWNALLHNPDNSVVDVLAPGESCVWKDSSPSGMWNRLAVVADAGHGWTYLIVSVACDAPNFTDAPAQAKLPANGDRSRLLMGGLGKPGSKARAMAVLQEAGFDEPARVLAHLPESDLFERCSADRLPLDELHGSMSSPGKRVVLLGDAAHGMFAGPGQGARTTFEDAHTLMSALEQQRMHLAGSGWQLAAGSSPADAISRDQEAPSAAPLAASKLPLNCQAADAAAVHAAVTHYEGLRMPRTCRIQRYAAEGCLLPAIRDKLRPAGLEPQQYVARTMEFVQWVNQFPDNQLGDPASTYWQPLP